MALYVVAHASYDPDQPHTFVPHGAVLHFYAHADTRLAVVLGMMALWRNTMGPQIAGSGQSLHQYGGGEPVENYSLSPITTDQMARYLVGVPESAANSVVFVGGHDSLLPSRTRLCTGTAATCRDGAHRCSGALGVLPAVDRDVHLITCRAASDDPAPDATAHYPGEQDEGHFKSRYDDMVEAVATLIQEDPEQAWRLLNAGDDRASELTRALVMQDELTEAAFYGEAVKEFLRDNDDGDLFHFLLGREPEVQRVYLRDELVRGVVVDQAREVIEGEGAQGFARLAAQPGFAPALLRVCLEDPEFVGEAELWSFLVASWDRLPQEDRAVAWESLPEEGRRHLQEAFDGGQGNG